MNKFHQKKLVLAFSDNAHHNCLVFILISDFYDSLGRDISYHGTEFYNLVTKKISNGWYYCKERTQPIGTSLCGENCIYYALMKCTGYEMSRIIKSMNPENVLLVVQRTFHDGFTYKCPLLQNCVKC